MQASWKRNGLVYIVFLLTGVILATMLLSAPQKPDEVPLSEVIAMSRDEKIDNIVEQGQWLTITTTDGEEIKTK